VQRPYARCGASSPAHAANARSAAAARSHASSSVVELAISGAPGIGAVTSWDIACARRNFRLTSGPTVARNSRERSAGYADIEHSTDCAQCAIAHASLGSGLPPRSAATRSVKTAIGSDMRKRIRVGGAAHEMH
jgi:hypothetical protein